MVSRTLDGDLLIEVTLDEPSNVQLNVGGVIRGYVVGGVIRGYVTAANSMSRARSDRK